MDRGVAAAVGPLPDRDRKDLAIQALAGSETVSDLAARHGVSRKFVYQQTRRVHAALDGAFSSAKQDTEEVLFELAVTEAWLRQVIVGLALICRGSYRGVVEFLRDLPLCHSSCRAFRTAERGGAGDREWHDTDEHSGSASSRGCCRRRARRLTWSPARSGSAPARWTAGERQRWPRRVGWPAASAGRRRRGWRR